MTIFETSFTFGTNNLGIAEIRRRVADVFCFRLGKIFVHVYEDEFRGKALRWIIKMNN